MKTRVYAIIISVFLLLAILCGCSKKSASTLPSLSALAPLPNSSIVEIVQNYDQDTLWVTWGEPVRSMAGNSGDIWALDNTRELLVFYNEYQKVFAVQIK